MPDRRRDSPRRQRSVATQLSATQPLSRSTCGDEGRWSVMTRLRCMCRWRRSPSEAAQRGAGSARRWAGSAAAPYQLLSERGTLLGTLAPSLSFANEIGSGFSEAARAGQAVAADVAARVFAKGQSNIGATTPCSSQPPVQSADGGARLRAESADRRGNSGRRTARQLHQHSSPTTSSLASGCSRPRSRPPRTTSSRPR